MIIINIDGLIGAGKSTLIKRLKVLFPKEIFIEETVDDILPLLKNYYDNPKKYAYEFQLTMLCRKYDLYLNAIEHNRSAKFIFFDRSPMHDKVFCRYHVEQNNITKEEYGEYLILLNKFIADMERHNMYNIYIDTDIDTCLYRIRLRNRGNESSGITKEYMLKLSSYINDEKIIVTHHITSDISNDKLLSLVTYLN